MSSTGERPTLSSLRHSRECNGSSTLAVVQALESAPPPKVERVHDSMSKPFHDFAKEAEKLSPLAVMSEQTKVCSG